MQALSLSQVILCFGEAPFLGMPCVLLRSHTSPEISSPSTIHVFWMSRGLREPLLHGHVEDIDVQFHENFRSGKKDKQIALRSIAPISCSAAHCVHAPLLVNSATFLHATNKTHRSRHNAVRALANLIFGGGSVVGKTIMSPGRTN